MKTGFVLDFTKRPKIHGLMKETAVLESVPLGGVSEALGVWLFVDPTVGSLFSGFTV